MQNHHYYPISHLKKLKQADPGLYHQLDRITAEIHHICMAESKEPPLTDFIHCMDLIDIFSELLHTINQCFKSKTRRPFLGHIDQYGLRKTKIDVALAIYRDIREAER